MPKEKKHYVYILTRKKNGTLYIGITNNLVKRANEHKNNIRSSFTKKYKVHKLAYYEVFQDVGDAITREKIEKMESKLEN
jgi:putative endonuclease